MASKEVLVLRGTLEGHNGWVTALATTPAQPDLLLSASRDKTLITWQLTRDDQQYGVPKKSLKGHSHIVQDAVIAPDGLFALSASWDRSLRLWNLESGECTQTFNGHEGDVLSVSISKNSRQIVSGSRDKTVKVWNAIGSCKSTLQGHTDWVSSVRFSPGDSATVISAGWDKLVKSWDLEKFSISADFIGHTGYVSTITISPDGTLVASAGKDGSIILWDLNLQKILYTLSAGDEVHALAFSPNRYWLTAATASSIKVFDLQERVLVDELKPEFANYSAKARDPEAISLAWSADGQNLFAGYTDSIIRVWQVMTSSQ